MRSAIWRSSFKLVVVKMCSSHWASFSTPSMVLPDISGSRHRVWIWLPQELNSIRS
ncbi:hypothetical protein D3C81_1943100 [compost metagenome]